MQVHSLQTHSKPNKSKKSNAKHLLKQSILQLYEIYSSKNSIPSIQSLYIKVLELTSIIYLNQLNCGKDVIDFSDILNNNLILGMKIKYFNMVAGFAYLIVKFLNESSDSLTYHLNIIKTIATQKLVNANHQSNQNSNNDITSQLLLVFQNLKSLIFFNTYSITQKTEALVERTLTSLGKLMQWNELKFNNIQNNNAQLNMQQPFFHTCLKLLKICKLTRRNSIYKQILASYFQYIDNNKLIPTLDICKLTLDAISINQQVSNEQLINIQQLSSQQQKIIDKNDEQITGFIIRKCFHLLREHYNKNHFFVLDQVLIQTLNKSLTTSPYCNNSKSILVIFQCLLVINKLQLVTNDYEWNQIGSEFESQNIKINSKNNHDNCQVSIIKVCKFVSSCHLFILTIINYLTQSQKNRPQQQKQLILAISKLKKYLKKYISILMLYNQHQIMNIWNHIINNLNLIKQEVIKKFQRKSTLIYRSWILNWSFCAQIQQNIITNTEHQKACDNLYKKLQKSNLYILIGKQYLLPQQVTFTNKFNTDRPNQNPWNMEIVRLCRQVDRLMNEEKMFIYWDELISIGASLWQVCGDIRSLLRVSSVLKQLIKCKNMVLFAHGCQSKQNNEKYYKMNGLYNLLISFIRPSQINTQEGQERHLLTCQINQLYCNQNSKGSKSIQNVRMERQRIKSQIMVEIFKQFIEPIIQTSIYISSHSHYPLTCQNPSSLQNYRNSYPPYYELFAYSIAITPLIRSQLTLQQRAYIARLITQISQTNDQLLLNNIRYVYHKTVANHLQDYTYTLANKINYTNKNQYTIKQEKQSLFKKKIILTNYLQFYASLYPNNQQSQTKQPKQFNDKSDHSQTGHTIVKKLNYRRSSVYMRQALQWQIQPPQNMNTEQEVQHSQINTAYSKILFIDFMYWVIHYCSIKQLIQIESLSREILEQWLDGQILQEFLVNIVKMCKNKITMNQQKPNHIMQYIELMTQCCNKLLYLSCRSATSKMMAGSKKNEKNCPENPVKQDTSDPQNSSGVNNIGYQKINVQFQIQEASIHINRINMLIVPFAKLIQQSIFQIDNFIIKENYANNWINQFMESNWNDISERQNLSKDQYAVKNPNRLITCLNNLIGFAYNIGHHYYIELKNNNTESNTTEINVLNILCTFKLMLINKIYGGWMCYHAFSQMVFMGYLPKTNQKIQQIQKNINNYEQQLCKTDQKIFDSTKMNNIKDKKDKDTSSLEQNLILITKLYLSLLKPNNQQKLLSLMSTNYQSFNTCLKVVHLLQSLVHMHPHKPIMRTISGYIWTKNCLNEAALLKYEQPILPITSSTMQYLSNKMNAESKIKAIWEYSSSQLQHSLLSLSLIRLLQCLILHGQLSEFRSTLKFSLLYFIRSRNTFGILLSLRSYFTRTKYINFASLQSTTFQENETASNQQHPTTEHLSKLDMLSICDSMTTIFSTLHPLSFNKKTFDKYSKLVLGAGNRRRTSISFHVSMESITNILSQSLGKCGRKGAELVMILGQYACKALGLREEYIVYKKYSQLINSKNEYEQRNQIKEIKDYQLNKHLTKKFLQFFAKIQQKLCNNTITTQQLQYIFIEQIRNFIPYSYHYASIIENMLSNIIQQALNDNIILQLSILMLDQSYNYKKMIESTQQLGLNTNTGDQPKCTYLESINKANSKYDLFVNQYLAKHMKRLQYLLSSYLKYPLTIIYPFGDRIYSLSVSSPLLVLHIDRGQFDDYINTVDTLIANNSKLLNNKSIDHKQWWKSRDRVDRSISKIVNQINIPLWDLLVTQNNYTNKLKDKQLKQYKLIENIIKHYGNDKKQLTNIINYTNLNLNQNIINQYIININQLSNRQSYLINNQQCYNQNLLLLTYHSYTLFPFQANLHLKQRAIYRIPSIQYLLTQHQKGLTHKIININSLNYLVNSGNDLPQTEKSFYKIKQNYPHWKGIIGKKPSFKEYFHLLQLDCFLFMGHGIGSQHIKDKQFFCKNIMALIMLFGCNSAAITQGKCQPNGVAHSHLLNGAPGLLGCLWEVTDKDTDKMTQSIFKTISHHPQNLSRIVSLAKKKCKHQCLNGGAIVMFGIPIYVHNS